MVVGVPRMARIGKRQLLRWSTKREFMQRLFAEQNGTSCAKSSDRRSIFPRDIVQQNFRMARRRQTGDIDVVLDANWNAVQRPEPTTRRDRRLRYTRGA